MIKKLLKNYRDKYLLQVREQVCDLVSKNSRVIDIGCGDGELLRILSSKINFGIGIDKNKKELGIAKRLTRKGIIKNLDFRFADAGDNLNERFDYSVLMFVLHSLDYDSWTEVLKNAKRNSNKLIIVDYEPTQEISLFIHFEEILAGHYRRFRDYLRRGGIEKLIEKNSFEKVDTYKNYIKIWKIDIRKS